MAYCGPRGIPLTVFLGWDPVDQDAALGWARYEKRRCSRCGWHPDEASTHPHTHVNTCPGCAALDGHDRKDLPAGAHVHLAPGSVAECDRCLAAADANRPRRR